MLDVNDQISILKKLNNQIKENKQQLQKLKSQRKDQINNITQAIQNHIESLSIKEAKEWANDFYWNNKEFPGRLKKAYKNVFGSFYTPIPKEMEVPCTECQKIEIVFCKTWSNYEHKKDKSWTYEKHLCQTCKKLKKPKENNQNNGFNIGCNDDETIENKYTLNELKNMPYSEYLQTEHWQRMRKTALRNASYRCQLCNKQNKLDVHHRTYDRLGHEYFADLIALCRECHEKHHDIEEIAQFIEV